MKHKIRYTGVEIAKANAGIADRLYRIAVRNDRFYSEEHKSRLVNMLLDLYYENVFAGEMELTTLRGILTQVKDIVESEHVHDWDYVDCGNEINIDGLLYRFVCKKCGDYKRIEEHDLKQSISTVIDHKQSAEPTLLIPHDDAADSGGERYSLGSAGR